MVKLDRHVSELGLYVSRMKLALNKILATLDGLYHFMVLNQAVPSLEKAVISFIHANQQIINNVVDAVYGRMTPLSTLEFGEKECCFTPLFDIRYIHHYYLLLTSFKMSLRCMK